jgi:hypothetical protein
MPGKVLADRIRHFSISDELRTSSFLIQRGLREMQDPDTYRDFLHLPMLLLSSGFERFFKAIYCCWHHAQKGGYPSIADLKGPNGKKGHDLLFHLDRVIEKCFSADYREHSAGGADFRFLQEDELLRKIIMLLSDFGKKTRYYDLDVVVGEQTDHRSPDDLWGKEIELAVLDQNPAWYEELSQIGNQIRQKTVTKVVKILERGTRAVARLMTIGGLGEPAKMNSTYFSCFLGLKEEDLGSRIY